MKSNCFETYDKYHLKPIEVSSLPCHELELEPDVAQAICTIKFVCF